MDFFICRKIIRKEPDGIVIRHKNKKKYVYSKIVNLIFLKLYLYKRIFKLLFTLKSSFIYFLN